MKERLIEVRPSQVDELRAGREVAVAGVRIRISEVMDSRDVATLAGLTPQGIRAMAQRGDLPCVRHGSRLVIHRERILASLGSRER